MDVTYEEFELLKTRVGTLELEKEELETMVNIFRKYIPYIYRQSIENPVAGIFEISIPIDQVLGESVIFFLPYMSGIPIVEGVGQNILRIKQGAVTLGDYVFVKENINGVIDNVGEGVIAPNRTLILRLIHSNVAQKKAVVINANLENEISLGMLTVLGSTLFQTLPSLEIPGLDPDTLAKGSDLIQLRTEFDTFKGNEVTKIKVGTEEASVALENEPVGTMYVLMSDEYVNP